ncbi:MAG: hypothetical protein HYX76_06815 [Acidobacteria bacterium]|nr:hypothetical protein [Acidobacteriota bacterium]
MQPEIPRWIEAQHLPELRAFLGRIAELLDPELNRIDLEKLGTEHPVHAGRASELAHHVPIIGSRHPEVDLVEHDDARSLKAREVGHRRLEPPRASSVSPGDRARESLRVGERAHDVVQAETAFDVPLAHANVTAESRSVSE